MPLNCWLPARSALSPRSFFLSVRFNGPKNPDWRLRLPVSHHRSTGLLPLCSSSRTARFFLLLCELNAPLRRRWACI